MTTKDVFQRLMDALGRAGIPSMLTGSFASSYHGAPRATQDIDIVISPTVGQLRMLVKLLPESEYYIDLNAALEAQQRQRQFNIIDFASGWKIDLIIRKSRPFSREEFERRSMIDFHGIQLAIATAEDVLISKLEWAKLAQSQRQIDDAASILRIRERELDKEYIAKWVRQLQLIEQWEASCRAAGFNA